VNCQGTGGGQKIQVRSSAGRRKVNLNGYLSPADRAPAVFCFALYEGRTFAFAFALLPETDSQARQETDTRLISLLQSYNDSVVERRAAAEDRRRRAAFVEPTPEPTPEPTATRAPTPRPAPTRTPSAPPSPPTVSPPTTAPAVVAPQLVTPPTAIAVSASPTPDVGTVLTRPESQEGVDTLSTSTPMPTPTPRPPTATATPRPPTSTPTERPTSTPVPCPRTQPGCPGF
jgi:hypothetical protein